MRGFPRSAVLALSGLVFVCDVHAQVTSGYGVRADPFHGKAARHSGIDIASPAGAPIYATADAVVGRAQWAGAYGNLVELEHGGGFQTRYAHMMKILVRAGQFIRKGTIIGLVGSTGRSTGNHLHYEVRQDGKAVDPTPFIYGTREFVAVGPNIADGHVAMGGPEE